jgi:hypothetical protein
VLLGSGESRSATVTFAVLINGRRRGTLGVEGLHRGLVGLGISRPPGRKR